MPPEQIWGNYLENSVHVLRSTFSDEFLDKDTSTQTAPTGHRYWTAESAPRKSARGGGGEMRFS